MKLRGFEQELTAEQVQSFEELRAKARAAQRAEDEAVFRSLKARPDPLGTFRGGAQTKRGRGQRRNRRAKNRVVRTYGQSRMVFLHLYGVIRPPVTLDSIPLTFTVPP